MWLRRIPAWLVVVAALAGLPPAAGSAESWQATVPPEAKQAFERGMAAVKREAWDVAARYFEETQTATPAAPSVLFNLGLAHANAGHELTAIAWLRAYLAASPSAENAAAVRAEIERLKAAARSNVAKIFQAAAEAARQLPDEAEQIVALTYVSACQAQAGDLEGARATAPLDAEGGGEWTFPKELYGKALAEAGDLAGARQILDQLTDPDDKDTVLGAMSETLRGQGDLIGAWKAAREIDNASARSMQCWLVASDKIAEGDVVLAEEALSLSDDASDSSTLLLRMFWKQLEAGSLTAARQTVKRISDVYYKMRALRQLAMAQVASGDREAANATASDLLAMTPQGATSQDDLAIAKALLGDEKGALALIADYKGYGAYMSTAMGAAYGDLAFVHAMSGDLKGARRIEKLAVESIAKAHQDQIDDGTVEARFAEAQLARGDLAGALKTATESKEKWLPFDRVMRAIVEAQLANGEIVQALQTAQEMERWRKNNREAVDEAMQLIASAQAQTGALADAEQTIALMPPSEQKVQAMLALADAQRDANAVSEAVRILAAARQVVFSVETSPVHDAADIVSEMGKISRWLQQIADAQTLAGDQAGAQATRAGVELAQWLSLGRGVSRDDAVVRVEKELKNRGTRDWQGDPIAPRDVPSGIASVGEKLDAYLLVIQTLEKRFAR